MTLFDFAHRRAFVSVMHGMDRPNPLGGLTNALNICPIKKRNRCFCKKKKPLFVFLLSRDRLASFPRIFNLKIALRLPPAPGPSVLLLANAHKTARLIVAINDLKLLGSNHPPPSPQKKKKSSAAASRLKSTPAAMCNKHHSLIVALPLPAASTLVPARSPFYSSFLFPISIPQKHIFRLSSSFKYSSFLFPISIPQKHIFRLSSSFKFARRFAPGSDLIGFCVLLPQAHGFLGISLDLLDCRSANWRIS
jgi:hypothetical protein